MNSIPTSTIYQLAEADVSSVISTLPQSLPEESYSLVYYLLDLMATVVMQENVNKMSARNMSIVVSPNLYTVSTENPMVALTTAQKVSSDHYIKFNVHNRWRISRRMSCLPV